MCSSTGNYDRDPLKKERGIFGGKAYISDEEKSEREIVKNVSIGRKRRSLPTDQRTMTQLFSDNLDSDDEEMDLNEESECIEASSRVCKTKIKKGKTKFEKYNSAAVDQTTMSQFFDYMNENNEDNDVKTDGSQDNKMADKIENVLISENPVSGSMKLKKTIKNNLKTKNVSRKLRVRSKEIKLNNIPVIESPCSRVKTSRRHSVGAMSNRVQELRDERHENTPKNSRRSLSPVQQRGSGTRIRVNTSLTGSGKKSTHSLLKRNAKGETQLQIAAIKV
jgi:hypothetical protein